eukprot:g28854.t1
MQPLSDSALLELLAIYVKLCNQKPSSSESFELCKEADNFDERITVESLGTAGVPPRYIGSLYGLRESRLLMDECNSVTAFLREMLWNEVKNAELFALVSNVLLVLEDIWFICIVRKNDDEEIRR